jgi:hypothetical protein
VGIDIYFLFSDPKKVTKSQMSPVSPAYKKTGPGQLAAAKQLSEYSAKVDTDSEDCKIHSMCLTHAGNICVAMADCETHDVIVRLFSKNPEQFIWGTTGDFLTSEKSAIYHMNVCPIKHTNNDAILLVTNSREHRLHLVLPHDKTPAHPFPYKKEVIQAPRCATPLGDYGSPCVPLFALTLILALTQR